MPYYLNQTLIIFHLPKQIILDNPKIKSNHNPSIRNRAVPHGKTDVTKLVFAFRGCFGKAISIIV
jgi:hypothetical protein